MLYLSVVFLCIRLTDWTRQMPLLFVWPDVNNTIMLGPAVCKTRIAGETIQPKYY